MHPRGERTGGAVVHAAPALVLTQDIQALSHARLALMPRRPNRSFWFVGAGGLLSPPLLARLAQLTDVRVIADTQLERAECQLHARVDAQEFRAPDA
jgi:hypothetical protein